MDIRVLLLIANGGKPCRATKQRKCKERDHRTDGDKACVECKGCCEKTCERK